MAISTYNTTLKIGSTSVVIKDFPTILGKRSSLETTTLSDDAQTFIQGIRQQEDSFDFTANYDKTVYTAIEALSGGQSCELAFSDGSKYTWTGEASCSVNGAGVDEVLEMTITVVPSTVPVWSAGQ